VQLSELGGTQLALSHKATQAPSLLSHEIELAQELQRRRQRRRLEALLASLQVQPRVFFQAGANLRRATLPGAAQLAHFTAGQPGGSDRRGQPLTILTAVTCNRHQVAHRRMSRDLPLAYLFLDRGGKLTHQAQVARHPAQALVETPSELFLAHPLLVQGRKKPALLELRESFRAALAAVQ